MDNNINSKKESNRSVNKKNKILIIVLFWILVLIILLSIGIWYVQPSAFFYPWHDEKSYEFLKGHSEFEELKIQNGENTISGWIKYNNPKDEKSPLIIMYGGNAQNSSNTGRWFLESKIFDKFAGYNFLVIDYPTYGLSKGKISEKTLFDTGIKAYEFAEDLNCVNKDKIVVLGFSIGTGVAHYVASEKNPNGLIVVAPYDCALSLYNNAINIFHGPVKLLTRYKLDSKSYAQNINIKPLVITSKEDEVISYKFTENLLKFYKNEPQYLCVDKGDHNSYFSNEEVLNKIEEYLESKK